jgi:hypothetical protein
MSEKSYFYAEGDSRQGPVLLSHLQQMAATGRLKPDTLVWEVGTPNWVPASQIPGLVGTAAARPEFLSPGQGMAAPAQPGRRPMFAGPRRRRSNKEQWESFSRGMVWLGTSFGGVCILAGLGLLTLAGAAICMFVVRTEYGPTRVSVQQLEASNKPPDRAWLEITGADDTKGILFWPEMVAQTKGKDVNPGQKIDKSKIEWFFVPLVSREVFNDWNKTLLPPDVNPAGAKAKPPKTFTKLSYAKARVVLKFTVRQLEEKFPKAVQTFTENTGHWDPHYAEYQVTGTVGNYSSVPKPVMDEMEKTIKDMDKNRMILVINDGRPPSYFGIGLFLFFLSLPLFLPLGIWTGRTLFGARRGESGAPVSEGAFAGSPVPPAAAAAAQPGAFTVRSPGPAATAAAPPMSGPAVAPASAIAATSSAPAPPSVSYYYSQGGKSLGPVSLDQLRQLATTGQLRPQDMVWNKTAGQWLPASSVPGVFS